jgi:1,4-dihydroxy-2-naphthoyl-CoA hydrolase
MPRAGHLPAPRRADPGPGHDTLGFSCGAEASVTSSEVRVEQDSSRQIIADFTKASRDKLVGRMGIAILEATADRVVGTMPVEGNTQPYGLLHGGASCVLAETLGSLGAALHAGPGRFTVGIEISATHHRAAAAGTVTGIATKLHGGRTVATYETVISDDRGRRVCTARLTCVISDRVPGGGRPMPAADALAARAS